MENKQVLRPQENVLMMFNRYLDLAAKSEQEELLRKCRTLILDMKQAYLEIKPVCVDVEAVHAWWKVESDPNRNLYRQFSCSACGGWKHSLAYEHSGMNYCPNCGAKMDG